MDLPEPYVTLGVAVLLGLLVGLQRERAAKEIAGLRTFAIVTLVGAVCGLLVEPAGGWVAGAGLLGLAGLVAVGHFLDPRDGQERAGLTTETALLAMYLVGVLLAVVGRDVGAAVGAGVAMLLFFKKPMHRMVEQLGEEDVRAIMQFALITLIVLPTLPDRTVGPLDVINPRQVWLMVVLIVGMSLGGYIALKFLDTRRGTLVAGLLGGLISSTATTVSAARGAGGDGTKTRAGAQIGATMIALASAVVFVRVLVEIAVVAPDHFWELAWPIGGLLLVSLVAGFVLWLLLPRGGGAQIHAGRNPSRLQTALAFGAMYALVLLAVAWVRTTRFGDAGLYAVAALSGLTDMDAITLSVARLVNDGRVEPSNAWRAIVVASLSNLAFKAVVVGALGTGRLLLLVAIPFCVIAVAGAGLLLFA